MPRRILLVAIVVLSTAAVLVTGGALYERQTGQQREVSVVGRDFRFDPDQITVDEGDLVKVSFRAEDIPHSFTIDEYRIAKRAAAGQTVVFEFLANQTGTFTYYCNLSIDDRCREMKGELVVRAR